MIESTDTEGSYIEIYTLFVSVSCHLLTDYTLLKTFQYIVSPDLCMTDGINQEYTPHTTSCASVEFHISKRFKHKRIMGGFFSRFSIFFIFHSVPVMYILTTIMICCNQLDEALFTHPNDILMSPNCEAQLSLQGIQLSLLCNG